MTPIKPNLTPSEAVKVDNLCSRVLGDIGSIHARIAPSQADGRTEPMALELMALRRHVRDLQDAVRDIFPDAFFK